jgi:hypothetical protein
MSHSKIVIALVLASCFCRLAGAAEPAEPRVEHARAVLAAINEAAKKNHDLPLPADAKPGAAARREKDDLMAYYIRAAAAAAQRVPAERQAEAFLLALGIGLDTADLMRHNPVTRGLWLQIESDVERKRRLEVIGEPTVHGRHDLCQHFVVSCAFCAQLGLKAGEAAGIAKEVLDARDGGSGFSFADLSADLAGVTFAKRVLAEPKMLPLIEKSFVVADYTLSPKGLVEGLTQDEFAKDYGSVADKRFLTKFEALRKEVLELPGFKEKEKEKP